MFVCLLGMNINGEPTLNTGGDGLLVYLDNAIVFLLAQLTPIKADSTLYTRLVVG